MHARGRAFILASLLATVAAGCSEGVLRVVNADLPDTTVVDAAVVDVTHDIAIISELPVLDVAVAVDGQLDAEDVDAALDTANDTGPDDANPTDILIPSDSTDSDGVEDTTDGSPLDTLDVAEDSATDSDVVTPPGPFDDLAGLAGAELRAALLARIKDHSPLGYEGVGTARQVMFAVIDVHEGRLTCIYTGRTVAGENPNAAPLGTEPGPSIDTTPNQDCRWPDGSAVQGGCVFNVEHSWPRSLGADNSPASSDLHHLFPSWDLANNERGSNLFGETVCAGSQCPWTENGSESGPGPGGPDVFQVRQAFRGDIARAQFYFAVRYARAISATTESTLRAWSQQDPPDEAERARNDAIETYQRNRNPFVDRPDFVDAIDDF